MSSHVVQGLVFNCSICCFLYYFLVLSSCVIFSSSFCVPVFFPQPSCAPCALHLFPLDWFSAHFLLWIRLLPCPHLGTVFVYLTTEGGGWYEWMGSALGFQIWDLGKSSCSFMWGLQLCFQRDFRWEIIMKLLNLSSFEVDSGQKLSEWVSHAGRPWTD